jgi:hypothetical protein
MDSHAPVPLYDRKNPDVVLGHVTLAKGVEPVDLAIALNNARLCIRTPDALPAPAKFEAAKKARLDREAREQREAAAAARK